ncbi:MAG: hypothetical protein IKS51_07435 [Erysipelotrichaceae bacterium]|nr:hypothetical protein [Erysipelotrichaceae bacterium]
MSEKLIYQKTQNELTDQERIAVENSDVLYYAVYNNTVDQMYEITPEMQKFMDEYPYRSQDEIRDPKQLKVMAHFFNPAACQDWIFTEYYDYQEGQHYFYGCARLFEDIGWEWGMMPSLEELSSIDLGPMLGHLRIERDESVSVGDSLYDVMMSIDKDGLYDLGMMERSLEDLDRVIDFQKQKFALLRNVVDDEMYDKVVNYLYKENLDIDDVFDIDRYYYDRDNCFDQDKVDDYYETHEFPGYDSLIEDMFSQGEEPMQEFSNAMSKENDMDFGKEL